MGDTSEREALHQQMYAVSRDRELRSKTKLDKKTRSRLEEYVIKRLQTAFIGAIANFEDNFGQLWGHGKRTKLTEDEVYWETIWQRVRKKVLDNGNNEKRKFEDLMDALFGIITEY